MTTSSPNLSRLIEMAKSVRMSDGQIADQRNSFVYGNTRTENPAITRDMVEDAARSLSEKADAEEKTGR